MNCANHPEQASFSNCIVCGRPYCQVCLAQHAKGYICFECKAREDDSDKVPVGSQNICSPATAFGLGLIPGVGALCNGEYLKAFVHVKIGRASCRERV